ncbi:glycoside hydrolase family 2 protein, partial [Streptococcus sp. DD13]|uniref:glycoside hydrolase family 2 protein n=1 Tax=Streptococcus sp. DD13 TaxID=1777881 RepID=UPI0018D4CBDD
MRRLQGRRELKKDWYFSQTVDQERALSPDFRAADWQAISLPHDWSIFNDFDPHSPAQNEAGQLNGGTAWYRTSFLLDTDASQRTTRICFDGVYMNAKVFVNGQLVGHYPSGYTGFSYDISAYLRNDGQAEQLVVYVENQQPSSRWYSGSGIYRDVYLLVEDLVHIPEMGITITSPDLEKEQEGLVKTRLVTEVVNRGAVEPSVYIEQFILDARGKVVANGQTTVAKTVGANRSCLFEQDLLVFHPDLWDVADQTPVLYSLVTRLYRDGQLLSERTDRFGYRYMDWTADEGFFLNGRSLKIHGVCLHHDHGALGAVENEKAEYLRLKQMKEMGANAIRTSHNPASPQTLKWAAQLGLLVQEEAFDTWYGGKKTFDYGRFFEEKATHPDARDGDSWSDFDLRRMVVAGRNNPAIFMWSIGNEVSEANGDTHSLESVQRLVSVIKEVDSSRYVTMGMDAFRFGDGQGGHEKIAAHLDAVGLNYAEDNFENIRHQHPDWLLYGSETSSATRSRGSYFRPQEEWIGDNRPLRRFEQSDYGNDRVP